MEKKHILKLQNDRDGIGEFIFYDGPPFATGLPHYGHILAGTIKDSMTRYAAMSGFYVERRAGWDTHGVPIEYEIEKEHNIKSKKEIEELGIENYNNLCKNIVLKYADQWEEITNSYGRLIDFKNCYKTMDLSFMSSVWYIFKKLYDMDLVYQANRVMWYSPGVKTNLSNFEVSSNYQNMKETSIYILFPVLENSENILVWTTTPWTLMGNIAIAVNKDVNYVLVNVPGYKNIWCSEKMAKNMFKNSIVMKIKKGSELIGISYKSFNNTIGITNDELNFENQYKIIMADFVDEESGTGFVHIAPAFGEDDFNICIKQNITTVEGKNLVDYLDESGCVNNIIPEFEGIYYRDLNIKIIDACKNKEILYKKETIEHSIPFCWRSDKPLIPKIIKGWYVRASSLKEQMLLINEDINWVPDYMGKRRFKEWLENTKDWNISRSRYWGTPIPIWMTETGKIIVIGSVKELEGYTGYKFSDIHRHNVDISFEYENETYKRIPEIFDCWFESGSMFLGQSGYPEFNEKFSFPADFIAEGVDQTRGWFYTLLVLSTALFNKAPYKNVIVNGLVLAEDGKKMSKRLKNYPDPSTIIEKYGADAMRLYLINSPATRGETLRFVENGVKEIVRAFNIPLESAINFFNIHKKLYDDKYNDFQIKFEVGKNPMDMWICNEIEELYNFVKDKMEKYELYKIVQPMINFIEKFNNVYIKLNKYRFKNKNGDKEDWLNCLNVTNNVLLNYIILLAPIAPFITEKNYPNVFKKDEKYSIHLELFRDQKFIKGEKYNVVDDILKVIENVRIIRSNNKINHKKPLNSIIIYNENPEQLKIYKECISNELNIVEIDFKNIKELISDIIYFPNFKTIGQKCKKDTGKISGYISELKTKEILRSVKFLNHELSIFEDYEIGYILNKKIGKNQLFQNKIFVDIDLEYDINLYNSKLINSSIQEQRKLLNLNPWDKVDVYLYSENDFLKSLFISKEVKIGKPEVYFHHNKSIIDNNTIHIYFSGEI